MTESYPVSRLKLLKYDLGYLNHSGVGKTAEGILQTYLYCKRVFYDQQSQEVLITLKTMSIIR